MTARPFIVKRKWETAPDIAGLELIPSDGAALPIIEPGAHVEFVIQRPGQPPLMRHYSLCNAPSETSSYVFGVKREAQSRGGSSWIHELSEGDEVQLGDIRNLFPLQVSASKHLLLAGGIGITPLLAMAQALDSTGGDYELHYFVRDPSQVAFRERLYDASLAHRLYVHAGLSADQVRRVLEELLVRPAPGSHAYCCGPGVFMDAVEAAAEQRWPSERLHFERFQAAPVTSTEGAAAFEIELVRSGLKCTVQRDQTITQALVQHGVEIPTSCEQGVCGTCLTNVLEGTPDHRDGYLSKQEREGCKMILPCVSRARSPKLVLDL